MKVLLVGATGTIGRAIADSLQNQGHEIIAVSRKSSPSVNIRSREAISELFKQVGTIDAVICTAGVASFGHVNDLSSEQWKLALESKLMGQINLATFALRNLSKNGVVILTGGMTAYAPWPNTATYAMVNAGLEGFVRGAGVDIGKTNRILIVHPPLISETAKAMGQNPDKYPSAEKVAETYVAHLTSSETGKAVFCPGYLPA